MNAPHPLAELIARGVPPALAARLWRRWGDDAAALLRGDPYAALCGLAGVGFAVADQVARRLGCGEEDRRRLRGALRFALRLAAEDGHVCLPPDRALRWAARLLAVPGTDAPADALPAALDDLLDEGALVEDGGVVYLPELLDAEASLAEDLERVRLLGRPPLAGDPDAARRVAACAEARGLALVADQVDALVAALTQPLVAITGGPGTGKTTLLRVLAATVEDLSPRPRLLMAAPTGRAARRLAEATGCEAHTIHRLLEFQPGEDGAAGAFRRHREAPLEADLVVVDEASMLDVPLAAALLAALPDGATLVLVGDVDQLPPVGPGDVLRDVIASGRAAVVRLERVFRQAQGSEVAAEAARIRAGRLPELSEQDPAAALAGGCAFLPAREEGAAGAVVDAVRRLLVAGLDPDALHVMAPVRGGQAGVHALNERLQAALLPDAPGMPELRHGGARFRPGDRIMCVRNNYAKGRDGIFNGQVGRVVALGAGDRPELLARFDGEDVAYGADELDQLALAYASTVHKAQGSEFDVCVLCLVPGHAPLLRRNLVYTAITRARRGLVVVGSREALRRAVADRRVERRHGRLAERLRGAPAG